MVDMFWQLRKDKKTSDAYPANTSVHETGCLSRSSAEQNARLDGDVKPVLQTPPQHFVS